MRRMLPTVLLTVFFLVSCFRQASFPPLGSYSNIVVVTENGKVEGPTTALIRELQHPVDYYTKTELQFRVRLISAYDFEKEPPSKNMVLFGVVRQGEIGKIIESFIGSANVRRVLEGRSNVFKRLNYPTEGQLTVIVTASSRDFLAKAATENGEQIRDIIEESNRERLRAYLLQRENEDTSEEMYARYGFRVRVPFLYELNQQRRDVPGVELVRKMPHRGLTISWRSWDGEDISVADSTALYNMRADLAWKMYDNDVMRKDLVFFKEDRLGPYDAVRMEGYWENSKDLYGGPFRCFFVYDRVKSRVWIIDCLVYAPGFDKHILLRELQSVAETFSMS